ncbi:hypothetical protein [Pararhodonellum marinum]|uniref:hypothetical protein n=1 Tax=Pararhodonellum marinum TaxID=2755358 RepID=UPI0018900F37|nr:hypothetical protein [Pararhodonellum marinum]
MVTIFTSTKSHGNAGTHHSGAGNDVHKFTIPAGHRYTHHTITQATGHTGAATFHVVSAPAANATGNREIRVMWTNGPFSRCRYTLRVFGEKINVPVPPSNPVIVFGQQNWYNDAINCLNQKMPFTLRLQGLHALSVFNIIDPIRRGLRVVPNEAVSLGMTIAICVTIIGVAGLATFGACVLYAIHRGCTVKALYDTNLNAGSGSVNQKMDFNFFDCP